MKKVSRYITLAFLILMILHVPAIAQEQPGLRERADKFYRDYQYANAASIYLKLAGKDKPKLDDIERLASCYRMMNDFKAAENWYSRVVQNPESEPKSLFFYGEALKANAHYADAKKVFQDYASKTDDKTRVAVEIEGCDSAMIWLANPLPYKIKNELGVNTSLSEFSVFPKQGQVYYTGESEDKTLNSYGWTGNSFLRVYTANSNSELSLDNPQVFKSSVSNEVYHQGPLIANKSGNVLYITRTYPGKQAEISKEDKKKYRTNNLELYIYTKNATGGYDANPFAYNNVKEYSLGHASLSQDEKILYYVSDMPGGRGGTDIWYSELQTDGSWGKPVNAGIPINTPGDELFPSVSGNGTIYFSSDGIAGMGGLDIFSSTGSKSNWAKPVNLRSPVNSPADDFAFAQTDAGAQGYLSSNRNGGKGSDDIYSFNYTQPKLILALKGVTYHKKTNEVLPDVAVTLLSGNRAIIGKKNNENNGTFFFELDKEMDYLVLGTKAKFSSDSVKLSTKSMIKSDTLFVSLYLDPLFEVGKTIVLKNIHYDFDKDNIRPDAAKILDELVNIMRDNPTLEIELGSHTDSRGVDIYNLDLSQRRARSAVNYLVGKGIARSRMVAKGYGETQLLNRCANGVKCSAAEHQANRRTEFKILTSW